MPSIAKPSIFFLAACLVSLGLFSSLKLIRPYEGSTFSIQSDSIPVIDSTIVKEEFAIVGIGGVKGGLSGRRVLHRQEAYTSEFGEGMVNIKVCIDETGAVTMAKFTLRESTTAHSHLIQSSLVAARQWTFSPAADKRQCGIIRFWFRLP